MRCLDDTPIFGRVLIITTVLGGLLHGALLQSAMAGEREELLAKAQKSLEAQAAKVKDDPARPVYHVLPPAYWMNDPNGPIWHNGYYHLFYQHNPYGDGWGNMHWGHVRSKDLVHWEHQPIALWPSKSQGEEHVFSGSATVNGKGELMLFYTSIGNRAPEQWAAMPEDKDLVRWKKHAKNPLLTEKLHGETKVHEWRDPFIFRHGNGVYLVFGGNLNASQGGQAVVLVYRAENEELTEWKYLGVLFQHPDKEVKNIECPLFFPLAGKWVLIVSPHGPVQYFVGDLDGETMTFKPSQRGIMDYGSYYAPNVMFDPEGRCLLWGWIRDFPGGKGWNGCLTLPRELTLGDDGHVRQTPANELAQLRGQRKSFDDVQISGTRELRRGVRNAFELGVEIKLDEAREAGVRLGHTDERDGIVVALDGKELRVGDSRVPLAVKHNQPVSLRVFVDHSVLEVYVDDQICVSKVIPTGASGEGIEFFPTGGKAEFKSIQIWPMGTIWGKR